MSNPARALLADNGNDLSRAVSALVSEFTSPTATEARYALSDRGILLAGSSPELAKRGYGDLNFPVVFKADAANRTLLQKANLAGLCGYDFDHESWAPAFGDFSGAKEIGTRQRNMLSIGPAGIFGGVTFLDAGPFPYRLFPAHGIDSFDELLAHLDAHPIDLHTREGGPVATGG